MTYVCSAETNYLNREHHEGRGIVVESLGTVLVVADRS